MKLWKLMIMGVALVGAGLLMASAANAADVMKGGPVWMTSYSEAVKAAKEGNKLILADFTGSDWCGWCMKLHYEVFSKKEFNDWAQANVVLLVLDFPHGKKLPPELMKQNQELQEKYAITGYPTVVFLDSAGTLVGKSGYVSGGPTSWLKMAQAVLDTHKAGKKK